MSARRGVTLVEVMLAGAILALLAVALFDGVIFATRIARANAELVQAEGIAWDSAWTAFNEDYNKLRSEAVANTPRTIAISHHVAPLLCAYGDSEGNKPTLRVALVNSNEYVIITADVEWGLSGKRKTLSDTARVLPGTVPVQVIRGPLSRVKDY